MANWWKKLKYWQKGAIIGCLVGAATFYITSEVNIKSKLIAYITYPSNLINYGLYFAIGDSLNLNEGITLVSILSIWALLGALIGFIIGKVKGK